MSDPETRAPTPAKAWVSPIGELSNGNLYPYWNLKPSGLTPYFDVIRRTFASINPFAVQQVPTMERAALNVKVGNMFYREQPYPSGIHFTHRGPVHFDPTTEKRFEEKPYTDHVHATPKIVPVSIVPRFCEREIKNFKRCVLANDNREEVCKSEQENILAICPLWALNNLKEKKLGLLKDEARSNKKYKEVMQVPSYNKGRTVADVPLRSWQDGNRDNLRPNTMWADDRYADITAEEVAAARERVNKRRAAHPAPKAELPAYDRTFEVPSRETPLYSV